MHKPGHARQMFPTAPPRRPTARSPSRATALAQTAVIDLPGDPANHLPATALRVTLHRGQPYVDLELTIKDKAKDNWPEADWLCLPFKVATRNSASAATSA